MAEIEAYLPNFELDERNELCFDLDFARSQLPLEEKASLLKLFKQDQSDGILRGKAKKQELLWKLPFSRVATVSEIQTYEPCQAADSVIRNQLQKQGAIS